MAVLSSSLEGSAGSSSKKRGHPELEDDSSFGHHTENDKPTDKAFEELEMARIRRKVELVRQNNERAQ
jgi:hypothetical protein